jgi:hypothetical protein
MFELFRAAVGTIIEAKVPLYENDLYHFLDRKEDDERQIHIILHCLSSVISVGDDNAP